MIVKKHINKPKISSQTAMGTQNNVVILSKYDFKRKNVQQITKREIVNNTRFFLIKGDILPA